MLLTNPTSLPDVASRYLTLLQFPHSKGLLRKHIEEHPFYPSVYGLVNVLKKYQLNCIALEVAAEELDELPPPYIAFLRNQSSGNDFALVTAKDENSVLVSDGKQNAKKMTLDEFKFHWMDVVVVAEVVAESKQPGLAAAQDAAKKGKRKRITVGISAAAIFLLFILLAAGEVPPLYYGSFLFIVLTKCIGLFAALLLLSYEINPYNNVISQVCSVSRKAGCGAVLSSSGAGIAGIKWSEAGCYYFAASLLVSISPGIPPEVKAPLLALAAAAVSPYIIYSVYYQYRVVKQWCRLCLLVQAVLLAEVLWAVVVHWSRFTVPPVGIDTIAVLLICCFVPVAGWLLLKPLFKKAYQHILYSRAYHRLLFHPDIFNRFQFSQPMAADGWQQLGITLGNPGAAHTLLKVCNPYCGPCSKAHQKIEKILEAHKDINIRIIFTATEDDDDIRAIPVRHFVALAAQNPPAELQNALHNWYSAPIKDYGAFAAAFPVKGNTQSYNAELKAMRHWCVESGVTATPSFFLNGRKLPVEYGIEDIVNIL